MLIACGIVCVLVGLVGLVGQLVSVVSFPLAQRLGFQEKQERSDPLHSRLELNAARWDLAVNWALPLAGVLMLAGHAWWPFLALVAGGVYVDTGGREAAKLLGLKNLGIRIGSPNEVRLALGYFSLITAIGLWAVVLASIALLSADTVL